MLRSALLSFSLVFALALAAAGQVYTNGGYATSYPAAVPPSIANTVTSQDIPSVPAINTPTVHVGPTAGGPALGTTESQQTVQSGNAPESEVQVQSQAPLSVKVAANTSGNHQPPFNFGAASYGTNPYIDGGISNQDQSLAEVAQECKQKKQTANARVFTNADVDKLNGSQTGGIGGATTNASNSEWPANNGVITPPPANNEGAIAAPPSRNTGSSPFGPRTPDNTPPNTTPMPPENAPQANAKPSAAQPYEMAQNNPANAGIPPENTQTTASSSNNAAQRQALPKTASRLPLLGVLGFISISMGLFVRYQRTKDTK